MVNQSQDQIHIIIIFHNYSHNRAKHNQNSKMYKLWRRQLSKPTTCDLTAKRKQAQFAQYLAQIVKLIRKKQQFYTRILFVEVNAFSATIYAQSPSINNNIFNKTSFNENVGIRQHTSYSGLATSETINLNEGASNGKTSISIHELQNQVQILHTEEEEIMLSLKNYEEENFYLSKTYLYTMFVRLLETFQFGKQKVMLKSKNNETIYNKNWQKLYQENKVLLTQSYQNLVYTQNFNVVELVTTASKKQTHRIWTVVPPKIKKNQIALKPLIRLNSTQMRKSNSIEVKPKKNDIEELINKKLVVKQKKQMLTEKRVEERKKPKQKPVTMKQLYGILGIKIPKIQEGYAFRREMEIDALERNDLIQEQRKKWQKKCQSKNYSRNVTVSEPNQQN